jgi:hypothetical protein
MATPLNDDALDMFIDSAFAEQYPPKLVDYLELKLEDLRQGHNVHFNLPKLGRCKIVLSDRELLYLVILATDERYNIQSSTIPEIVDELLVIENADTASLEHVIAGLNLDLGFAKIRVAIGNGSQSQADACHADIIEAQIELASLRS